MGNKIIVTWDFEVLYRQGMSYLIKEDFSAAYRTLGLALNQVGWKDTGHHLIPSLIFFYKKATLLHNTLIRWRSHSAYTNFGFYKEVTPILEDLIQFTKNKKLHKVLHSVLTKTCFVFEDNFKFGLQDAQGKELIPAVYCDIKEIHFKRIAVHDGYGWRIIDRDNNLISSDYFDDVMYSRREESLVMIDGKYNLIQQNGTYLLPDWADNIYTDTKEDIVPVKYAGKWGFISLGGHWIVKPMYESVGTHVEGLARVDLNKRCGFIDTQGKVVADIMWRNAENFSEGLCAVKPRGFYGFIDRKGILRIVTAYRRIGYFLNGYCPVQFNDYWGLIDRTGDMVIPFIYDGLCWDHDEMLIAEVGGKRFYVNLKGILLARL